MNSGLLQRFVDTFQRGIDLEMEAIKEQILELLIPLGPGRCPEEGTVFPCRKPDRLFQGQSATLIQAEGTRLPVTVEDVGEGEVTLSSEVAFSPPAGESGLEVVPWFLYERMKLGLQELLKPDQPYAPEMALRVFGKVPSRRLPSARRLKFHPGLNEAQNRAVQYAFDHQLSFLWGPPGTGKTTTLARLLCQLHLHGRRVLVVSNTNTAIDQVLAQLKNQAETAPMIDRGEVRRLGTTKPEEPCALGNVVRTIYRSLVEDGTRLNERREHLRERLADLAQALEKLQARVQPEQLDLFGGGEGGLSEHELRALLSEDSPILRMAAEEQLDYLQTLKAGAEEELSRAKQAFQDNRRTLEKHRESILGQARIVLSTLANLTVHPLLEGECFDTVVIEEAGMAVLPAVFLAGARARQQVVVVDDPRQLPSILSSRNHTARKILGRSIFEVTVPEPETSELVCMLDVQYRMCPEIGRLVSGLFYGGALTNADATLGLAQKTDREPFPGRGVTVIDLAGKSRCRRPPNSRSRYNEESAQIALAIVRKGLDHGVESMAVITPYREQVRILERLFRQENIDLERVSCSTVHRFQGHEREVVVVDTVDAPPLEPGVLLCDQGPHSASAQLLNVSVSRAQAKLILLAEYQYMLSRPTGVLGDLLRQAGTDGQVVRVVLQTKVEPRAPVGGTGTRSDWD